MSDTTGFLLIAAVAVYGLALVLVGIAASYRAAKIRGIEREIGRIADAVDSLQREAEREKPEPKKPLRSMWGNHG